MIATSALLAYRANAAAVVDLVFRTSLGLVVEPYPMIWIRPTDLLTAAVYFAGAWQGAILLECTRNQANTFARLFLDGADLHPAEEDLRDAIGELANMVAGNLKSILPGGVTLSVPSVIEGSDYSLRICGKRHVERIPFWTGEEIFGVTLVEI